MRLTDYSLLHPTARSRVLALDAMLQREGIPLRTFESGRTPEEQANDFFKGRVGGFGPAGPPYVTFKKPWQGLHQIGFAVDKVFWVNNDWSWVEPEHGMWSKYWELAHACELEPLKFEAPHVQVPGIDSKEIAAGRLPPGGDSSWSDFVLGNAHRWGPGARTMHGILMPGAPPFVLPVHVEKPPIVLLPGLLYDETSGMCVAADPGA